MDITNSWIIRAMKYEEVVAERIIFDPNKIFEDEMQMDISWYPNLIKRKKIRMLILNEPFQNDIQSKGHKWKKLS